jgi:tyrosyl-tRNA synthetase
LATWFSLHDFISRENIRKRLDEGKRISLREVLYPLMQGYDSVMMDADIEIGGTDQRFNMLAGREAQRHAVDFMSPEDSALIREIIGCPPKQRSGNSIGDNPLAEAPQDVLMTGLILGTDGRKMSSSWGNTINLLDEPNDMFGKVMSIPDELIGSYFVHCTRVPMESIGEIMRAENPRDAKMRLAREIVSLYHGAERAEKAERYFVNTFSKRETPEDILEARAESGMNIVDCIVSTNLATSKGDAKRKIEQGGVELDGEKVTDWNLVLDTSLSGKVLKVGKKDFVRIMIP